MAEETHSGGVWFFVERNFEGRFMFNSGRGLYEGDMLLMGGMIFNAGDRIERQKSRREADGRYIESGTKGYNRRFLA